MPGCSLVDRSFPSRAAHLSCSNGVNVGEQFQNQSGCSLVDSSTLTENFLSRSGIFVLRQARIVSTLENNFRIRLKIRVGYCFFFSAVTSNLSSDVSALCCVQNAQKNSS